MGRNVENSILHYVFLCVWDVSELTCGSLNEMFAQIPHTPPHGHVIKDDTFSLWGLAIYRQQGECARMLCTIYWVASGLITTRNHYHSCQLWDKMIKLRPTFSFFRPKTTYEKYCLIILWPSSAILIRPSLAIQPCVFPPNKIIFFCVRNIFIAQESRQRIKIKQQNIK